MTDGDISLHREILNIEGDRNLYNYTFTDESGRLIAPEHGPKGKPEAEGNLTSTEGENRKG
jgi:hypothetical protein